MANSLLTFAVFLVSTLVALVSSAWLKGVLRKRYRSEREALEEQLRISMPSRDECESLSKRPGEEELLAGLKEELLRLSDLRRKDIVGGTLGWALAKVLFHVRRLGHPEGALAAKAEVSYLNLLRLLRIQVLEPSYRVFGFVLFAWLLVGGFSGLARIGIEPTTFGPAASALVPFAGYGTAGLVLYCVGGYLLRLLIHKTRTEKDDILVGASLGPIAAALGLKGLFETVSALGAMPKVVATLDQGYGFLFGSWWRSAATIVVLTWVGMTIFNKVVILALRRYVRRTEQKYDDMFVALLQLFGSFVILAAGFGILLLTLRSLFDVENFSVDVMLPYSIVVSVLSAVLGYASKDALENFLGGTLLQIDNPFKTGERLVLGTGEICDVREVGMRSTKLYNISENTELYIPNSLLANQVITNISRPDSELRIQVSVFVAVEVDGRCPLRMAELILMDIAYLDTEIENARITAADLDLDMEKDRIAIRDELARLESMHDKLRDLRLSMAKERKGRRIFVNRSLKIEEILTRIDDSRAEYQKALHLWPERQIHLAAIVESFQQLEEAVATLGEGVGDEARVAKSDLVRLVSELAKEPDIHSAFEVCEDGCVYLRVTLGIFTTHLARRLEVMHKLHQAIVERFLLEGIPVHSIRGGEGSRLLAA